MYEVSCSPERPFWGTISLCILNQFTSPCWFSLVRNFLGRIYRHLRFCHVMIFKIMFFVVLDCNPRSFRLLIKNLFCTVQIVSQIILIRQ